jgi:hypothetical protein
MAAMLGMLRCVLMEIETRQDGGKSPVRRSVRIVNPITTAGPRSQSGRAGGRASEGGARKARPGLCEPCACRVVVHVWRCQPVRGSKRFFSSLRLVD